MKSSPSPLGQVNYPSVFALKAVHPVVLVSLQVAVREVPVFKPNRVSISHNVSLALAHGLEDSPPLLVLGAHVLIEIDSACFGRVHEAIAFGRGGLAVQPQKRSAISANALGFMLQPNSEPARRVAEATVRPLLS